MSKQENDICPICGGRKRIAYTIEFRELSPHSISVDPSQMSTQFKLCPGHPEPAQRHDGWLGPNAEGLAPHVRHATDPWINKPMVRIEQANHPSMDLFPHQALSLRDWLIQESAELERLAKEQEG